MRTIFSVTISVWFLTMALQGPAFAYAGPGVALSAIVVALTVVGAFILLVFAWLYKPVKALIATARGKSSERSPANSVDETEEIG